MTKTGNWVRCAVGFLAALPVISFAASFNCAKAVSSNELMICADRQLSAMDDDIAVLYRAAKAEAPDTVAFKKETNAEWRRRERCTDRDCLVAWYQRRSSQLATVLNSAQSKEAPAKLVNPPVPVPAAPAADDSNGHSALLWLIGGLLSLVWVVKQRGAAGRRKAAEPFAAGTPKDNPVAADRSSADLSITVRVRSAGPARRLTPTKRSGQGVQSVWIGAGQTTVVKSVSIPGGMLYVGSTLAAPDGSTEPAQIDPTLEVDSHAADPQEHLFGYWPRYDEISPTARRAYLTWLAGGRQDPGADVGYVFLFFYGLERRVLVDGRTDAAATSEVPAILAEVERLRGIYNNRSFQSYSRSFLEYVATSGAFEKASYLKPPPPATASRGMPLLLRAGLGQCAVDGKPVPAAWALSWARSDPNVSMPRAATRCQGQFDGQFKRIYAERFADGLQLGVNRTKLKVSYRAASAGLLSENFSSDFGGCRM
jgi:TerB N-terminal domain